jgi:hypothetical protein
VVHIICSYCYILQWFRVLSIVEYCSYFADVVCMESLSSLDIATGYRLDNRVCIPDRGRFLFSIQSPIQWASRSLSSEVKGPRRETDYSPPTSAETKNGGPVSPLLMSSWHNTEHKAICPLTCS